MARSKRNSLAPQSQGAVTQAELLELKFLEWQCAHAGEFGLDPLHAQNPYKLAEGRIRQKLLDGCAVDPGALSAKLRWGWRSGQGRKWRHASLSVKASPENRRAKDDPALDPLEMQPVESQIDQEREDPSWRLAFALCRLAAPYATQQELDRFSKHLGVTPEDLLYGGRAHAQGL